MPEGNAAFQPTAKSQGRPKWLAWAIGSGAFAAFNGVFAKLTTASTTDSIADAISHFLGMSSESRFLEYVIRAVRPTSLRDTAGHA